MSTRWLVACALAVATAAACSDGDSPTNGSAAGRPADASVADGSTTDATATDGTAIDPSGVDTVAPPALRPCTLPAPLTIGYLADLSGAGAAFDASGAVAAQVRAGLVTAAGGAGGQPVELVVRDVDTDPAVAQAAVQELLAAGVEALLGPPSVEVGLAILDATGGQVPVIFPGATDARLADPSRGAFLASFSDTVQAAAAAEVAVALGASGVVTFAADDDRRTLDAATAFTLAFEQAAGELLQQYTYGRDDTDFTTQIEQVALLQPPPDALFTAMPMPALGALLQQLAFAGLDDLTVVTADRSDAASPWTAGAFAEGIHVTTPAFPSADNGVQALADAAAANGTPLTSTFGALASDAVEILVDAATSACALDGASLIGAIDEIDELRVTTGIVTYAGSNGVPLKDVTIVGVSSGMPAVEYLVRPTFVPTL
jgi:branched-chain amino acid transport system substrate-binding protein